MWRSFDHWTSKASDIAPLKRGKRNLTWLPCLQLLQFVVAFQRGFAACKLLMKYKTYQTGKERELCVRWKICNEHLLMDDIFYVIFQAKMSSESVCWKPVVSQWRFYKLNWKLKLLFKSRKKFPNCHCFVSSYWLGPDFVGLHVSLIFLRVLVLVDLSWVFTTASKLLGRSSVTPAHLLNPCCLSV